MTTIKAADTTITVSGPGSCISFEVKLIHDLLVANGYLVEVTDDHPLTDVPHGTQAQRAETVDEHMARIKKILDDDREKGIYQAIRLVANHQPWGG